MKINITKIIGASRDKHRLPPLDIEVEEGKQLSIGSKTFQIYDVDGHTVGHIAYASLEDKALFTGDSLMVMGCGRLFEGTPDDMWKSLKKLKQLPKDFMIYSGHEYTRSNIEFALTVDPQNDKLKARKINELEKLEKRLTYCSCYIGRGIRHQSFFKGKRAIYRRLYEHKKPRSGI